MPVVSNSNSTTEAGVLLNRLKVVQMADATTEALYLDAAPGTATAKFLPVAGKNDATMRAIRVDRFGSVQLAPLVIGLSEMIDSATLDSQSRWNSASLTWANPNQTLTGGIAINVGAVTSIGSASIQSQRRFERKMRNPLFSRSRARIVAATNSTIELGFFDSLGANTNTNGAYWQCTPAGVIQPVLTFNSVDVTGTNVASLLNSANYYQFDVIIDDDSATFIVQDTTTNAIVAEQTMQMPATQAKQWALSHIPYAARAYVAGSVAGSAPVLIVTEVLVGYMDVSGSMNKPWPHVASELHPSIWSPGAPTTITNTWVNSAEPASATLSNTTAGYSTLGGKFQFAAVAGAVTDFVLFGFQVPTGFTFVCTGISIETWNTGAAAATTPTLLHWFVAPNQFAVTFAGTTGRKSVGSQSIPVGAAMGANVAPATRAFTTPVVTQSARFFDIGLRIPVGTATASQVIAGAIDVEGYFE